MNPVLREIEEIIFEAGGGRLPKESRPPEFKMDRRSGIRASMYKTIFIIKILTG